MAPPFSALLIATTNAGKVREIRRALDGLPLPLLSLTNVPAVAEPEETADTFAGNALGKARYYSAHSGLPTVADDSGLSIDALGGRPGVESARYPGSTYPDKFNNLYRELAGHARPWTARFVCAIALVDPQGQLLFANEATVEGEIVPEPRGTNGFGYDPIFLYRPFGCTFGEATDPDKLTVSARGQAFDALREWLATPS